MLSACCPLVCRCCLVRSITYLLTYVYIRPRLPPPPCQSLLVAFGDRPFRAIQNLHAHTRSYLRHRDIHAQSLFTRMPNRSIHTLPCTHGTRNTSALGPRQAHEITAAFTAAQTAQAAPHRAPPRAPPHAVPSQGREVGQAGQACQQGGGWRRGSGGDWWPERMPGMEGTLSNLINTST